MEAVRTCAQKRPLRGRRTEAVCVRTAGWWGLGVETYSHRATFRLYQTQKNSLGANIFWVSPDNGRRPMQSAWLKRVKGRVVDAAAHSAQRTLPTLAFYMWEAGRGTRGATGSTRKRFSWADRLSLLERQVIGANRRPARRFAPGGFCLPSASIAALLLQSLLRGESDVASGTVKWFNGQKGYSFIAPDGGGKDVFVHISAVEKAGLDGLPDGAKVTFDIVSNRGKESAENLRVK